MKAAFASTSNAVWPAPLAAAAAERRPLALGPGADPARALIFRLESSEHRQALAGLRAAALADPPKKLSQNSACATGERRTERGKDAGRSNSGHYSTDRGRRLAKCVRRRQAWAGGFETASKAPRDFPPPPLRQSWRARPAERLAASPIPSSDLRLATSSHRFGVRLTKQLKDAGSEACFARKRPRTASCAVSQGHPKHLSPWERGETQSNPQER
jgi:hypothetical protein